MAGAASAIGGIAKAAGPVMKGVSDIVGAAKGGGGGGGKAEEAKGAKGGGDKKKGEDPVQQLAKILAEALKQASGKGAKAA